MKDYVNLLPLNYRRACLVRRRLRAWSIAWSAIAVGLGCAWCYERTRWQAAYDELEKQERRYDEVRSLKAKIARLVAETQQLSKQQDFVVRLQQSPPPLLPLALVSAGAARCEGAVAVRQMIYAGDGSSTSLAAIEPQAQAGTQPASNIQDVQHTQTARLTIDGIGADNLAIAEFLLGLRESGVFERVELKSAATGATDNLTTYQVECGL